MIFGGEGGKRGVAVGALFWFSEAGTFQTEPELWRWGVSEESEPCVRFFLELRSGPVVRLGPMMGADSESGEDEVLEGGGGYRGGGGGVGEGVEGMQSAEGGGCISLSVAEVECSQTDPKDLSLFISI